MTPRAVVFAAILLACCGQGERHRVNESAEDAGVTENRGQSIGRSGSRKAVVYTWVDSSGRVHMSSSVEQIPPEYRRRVVVSDLSRPRRERFASDRAIVADFTASSDGQPLNYTVVDLDALAEKGRPEGSGVGNSAARVAARLADDIVDGVLQLAGFRVERGTASAGATVILYETSWCGFCKKAAEYLRSRKVAFQQKDIEKDAAAAAELAEKLRREGLSHQGVPVLDIGGRLVLGFDRERIDYLLKEAGR